MSKTILIVEDNVANMHLFCDVLESQGYITLQLGDGDGVVEMARQHSPDLILIDIQLPTVSGLEVARWLKGDENLRSIPIIAVTAFTKEGSQEKALQHGCDAYISKPISVRKFLETVGHFLR